VENQVRVRSALSGLHHLLESLAPLMVMSDSGDLGSFFDPAARFAENQPAIIFYDNVPAGIGLTEYLFNHFDDLLLQAGGLVKTCECSEGCPSCVGPSVDLAGGGKKETQQLIKYLQE
jgi:DEAD/DEAH box helicase domain-containing protein